MIRAPSNDLTIRRQLRDKDHLAVQVRKTDTDTIRCLQTAENIRWFGRVSPLVPYYYLGNHMISTSLFPSPAWT